jgi:hypothetical protein
MNVSTDTVYLFKFDVKYTYAGGLVTVTSVCLL